MIHPVSLNIFQNDDIVPSSTVDDAVTEFNLSSPIKYNHNKVFLHSPKPSVSNVFIWL